MKKIIAFILALTMIFALCACGDNGANPTASVGQGLGNEELFAGLWLDIDEFYDEDIECLFFSTDGYTYCEYYDLTDEDDFDRLNNLIECTKSDYSSSAIEKYCAYNIYGFEGRCDIDALYQAAELAVGKYNIKNDEVTISYSYGVENTGLYISGSSILEVDFYDDYNYTFEKYDYYLDDSYRYFVGNWNVSYVEKWDDENFDSSNYMLSLGENLRYNISTGYKSTNSYNWSYMNRELRIGDGWPEEDSVEGTTIRLSYNQFAVFCSKDTDYGEQYYSWIFERA